MTEEVKQAQNVVTSENLQEFQLNRLGIKPEEPKEEVKEEAKEEKEEIKEETLEEEDESEEKKEKHPLKERFSKLTKQRNEAREEAARKEAELAALKAKLKEFETPKEVKQEENAKPDPKNFTDAFEYAEKLAEWSAKEAIRNKEKEESQRKEREVQEKVHETWRTRLEKAKAEIEDYDEVLATTDTSVSDELRDAIFKSEYGPQILYELAKDEDLAVKMSKMTLDELYKKLGKMETKYEKQEEKPIEKPKPEVSKAPQPIKAITSGKVETDAVDAKGEVKVDFAEYKALRKAGKLK